MVETVQDPVFFNQKGPRRKRINQRLKKKPVLTLIGLIFSQP